jgi:hypothetical protein
MKYFLLATLLNTLFMTNLAQAENENAIRCGGDGGFKVIFNKSLSAISSGSEEATYKNIMPFPSQEVSVGSEDPIFHLKHFTFGTAYCTFHFAVDISQVDSFVTMASSLCEGEQTILQCSATNE